MSEEHEDYGQSYTFSSGIKVVILAFPAMRFDKFIKTSKKKFPLPKPPKKKIKTVDGVETIPNLKDKKYLKELKIVEGKQGEWLNEKVLRVCLRDCIQLDVTKYEEIITELEEDNEELYPENLIKRKVEFLIDYVIRGASDYQSLVKISTELMRIDESEVSEQLETFSDNVE